MLSALVGVVALHHPYNPFQEGDPPTNELFSTKEIFAIAKHPPNCVRKPLPLSTLRSNHSRHYHAFDNVLLIVFFSHPRYDVNLDYYQDIYSDYFPNVSFFLCIVFIDLTWVQILFIGPASREDKGFLHSYDVLVDSYQAHEDLSDPLVYNMAGRVKSFALSMISLSYQCLVHRWHIICFTPLSKIMIVMMGTCGHPLMHFLMCLAFNNLIKTNSGIIHHGVNLFITPLMSLPKRIDMRLRPWSHQILLKIYRSRGEDGVRIGGGRLWFSLCIFTEHVL